MRETFKTPSREEILYGPIFRTMVRIGGPAVISSILFTLYNLVDSAWIGRLPAETVPLASSGMSVSWPIFWFVVSFVAGFGGAAVGALVTQHIGAGRPKEATFALNQLISISAVAGVVLGVAGCLLTPTLLSLLVADPAIAAHASKYLQIVFLGLPVMLLPQLLYFAFSATGDTVTPLLVTVVGVGINMVLDPLFILGWGGLPQMGTQGVAIATVISQAISTAVFLMLMRRGRGALRLVREALCLRWTWLVKALRIGFPSGIGQSAVALGFIVLMVVIDRLDNPAIAYAGYGYANRIFGLLFIATQGIGIGLTTMVGQALGAGMLARAREVVRKGVVALFAILVLEAGVIYLVRFPLIALFVPGQDEIIREAARFIEIFAAGMPFLGAFFGAEAVFRGSGHNMLPMAIGLARLWGLRLPLAYLFAFGLRMQADGIWLGMSLSNVVSGLASIGVLLSRRWQRSRIETPASEESLPETSS